jgi:hypothetical protein
VNIVAAVFALFKLKILPILAISCPSL